MLHWDRLCRSSLLPHLVAVFWHRANQSCLLALQHQASGKVAARVALFFKTPPGLTCLRSLCFVICAVLKKPQLDWFTVAVSFQSHSDNASLCCVEETTARLVYCCSFLPITQWQCKSYLYQETRSRAQLRKLPDYISGVHHLWWDFCVCDSSCLFVCLFRP